MFKFIDFSKYWQRLCLVFFGGGILSLALPPYGIWAILMISFPILFVMIFNYTNSRPQIALLIFIFCLGYFLLSLYWVGNALTVFSPDLSILAPFASGGLALLCASYYGILGLGIGFFVKCRLQLILALILLFSLGDMIRQYIFTGFAFNLWGYIFATNLNLSQLASFLGIEGMGLLVLIAALLPCLIVKKDIKSFAYRILIFLSIPTIGYIYGFILLQSAPHSPATEGFGIRLVQANIPQENKWDQHKIFNNFMEQITLSQAQRPDWVKLVVWPESAIPFAIEDVPEVSAQLQKITPKDGYLAVGTIRYLDKLSPLNSLRIYDSLGRNLGNYDKTHLVPFGEYLPLKNILAPLGFLKLTGGNDYMAGTERLTLPEKRLAPLALSLPPLTALICYEAVFSRDIIGKGQRRANWILNVTNDAWFEGTIGPLQHFFHARLRAIEQGLPLVRSTNTGISAVFDGYGRTLIKIDENVKGVADFHLPPPLPPSFYSQYATLLFWIGIGLIGGLLFMLKISNSCKFLKNKAYTKL